LLFNLPVGTVPGTYSSNLASNPQIGATGTRPSPYYLPKTASPLMARGLNVGLAFTGAAPNIGAY